VVPLETLLVAVVCMMHSDAGAATVRDTVPGHYGACRVGTLLAHALVDDLLDQERRISSSACLSAASGLRRSSGCSPGGSIRSISLEQQRLGHTTAVSRWFASGSNDANTTRHLARHPCRHVSRCLAGLSRPSAGAGHAGIGCIASTYAPPVSISCGSCSPPASGVKSGQHGRGFGVGMGKLFSNARSQAARARPFAS
jgi:hypothetical protein